MADRSPRRILIIALIVVAILAGWGIFSRYRAESRLRDETEEAAVPAVNVMKAPQSGGAEEVILPGTVQAWHEAPIYARTNGYVKFWKTDIGARVEAGQELAEIETPEVDAQMHQAEADLATAEANSALAQTTARRWLSLLKTNSVSRQETDEKVSDAKAKAAATASARANLDRLKQLEGFRHVVAPFAGIITARNIDTGTLINAGSGTGAGMEMFHIAELQKLRIYVQVPELYTPGITRDLTADMVFAEHPGKRFTAKLVDTAHALDPAARTLLVQFAVDNADGQLMPGGYTQAHLLLTQAGVNVRLPVNTLIFRSGGMQVATVGKDSTAQLKDITIGRDFGKEVEVAAGVEPDETIIVNPPDSLVTGEKIRVVTPKEMEKEEQKKDEQKSDKDEKVAKKEAGEDSNKVTSAEKKEGVVIKNESSGKKGNADGDTKVKDEGKQ